MPIFTKDDQRVLFAHIPKTAGISIYLAFVAAGWRISNYKHRTTPRSAGAMLKEKYGVESFPVDGRTFLYPHAIQHAPHFIWRHWGEFDDSFAVIRHPSDRLLSSLRYRLDWQKKRARPHDSVDAKVQSLLKSNWWVWMKVGGHLVPQHHFVAADTVLFRFEDSWQKQLCDRFGLDLENFPKVNVSKKNEMVFNNETEVAIRRRYAKDFALFGYE